MTKKKKKKRIEKEERPGEVCWQCSNLYSCGQYFTCDKQDLMIDPLEVALGECEFKNTDRKEMRGRAIELWKVLTMLGTPVALQSLPDCLIGSMGLLRKYHLVKEAILPVPARLPKGDMFYNTKQKFIELEARK
jgi:hypothetical protein